MEVSGESPGRLFGLLVLPDAGAMGAGLPGLPGSCHSELLPPSPSGRAATAVAVSSHPWPAWFSSKTSPSGVLTVSSAPDSERRTPLGRSSCLVSFFRLVSFYPSGWIGAAARELVFRFSPFLFLGIFVIWRSMDGELEWAFPSDCSFFQLWGCPASAVAVAVIRGRV